MGRWRLLLVHLLLPLVSPLELDLVQELSEGWHLTLQMLTFPLPLAPREMKLI